MRGRLETGWIRGTGKVLEDARVGKEWTQEGGGHDGRLWFISPAMRAEGRDRSMRTGHVRGLS